MTNYSKLKDSVANLEAQFQNLREIRSKAALSELLLEGIQESVIKRFDIALEMCWKLLMKYISEEVGIKEVPNGPKPIFRLADQNDLLDGKIEEWIEFVDVRNSSAHDYSFEKATRTVEVIPDFIVEAKKLYCKISGLPWNE